MQRRIATFFDPEYTDYEGIKASVMALVINGADPSLANEKGDTPMEVAIQREMEDCISLMQLASARGPLN